MNCQPIFEAPIIFKKACRNLNELFRFPGLLATKIQRRTLQKLKEHEW